MSGRRPKNFPLKENILNNDDGGFLHEQISPLTLTVIELKLEFIDQSSIPVFPIKSFGSDSASSLDFRNAKPDH